MGKTNTVTANIVDKSGPDVSLFPSSSKILLW